MLLSAKLIAAPTRRLTLGLRWQLHRYRPAPQIYTARPIGTTLHGKSSLEILNQSYSGAICFSPTQLTYDLKDTLHAFKPNDGYHATGLELITDNLDLIVVESSGFSADGAGADTLFSSENSRTAFVQVPDPRPWKLNSSDRFGRYLLTPRLIAPAAEQFVTRLSQDGEIPRFNIRYQEIYSRFEKIFQLKYTEFLLAAWEISPVSTETDFHIYPVLRKEAQILRQKIENDNCLLGLDKDNLELFAFTPDFSFHVRRFFSRPHRLRSAELAQR
jgi:hypothetical protein